MKTLQKIQRAIKDMKYRYKLMAIILSAGLLSITIITIYMQAGMTKILKEKEINNMELSLEQAVKAIENQKQIYKNLVDYLSYSDDLRSVLELTSSSDYEKYIVYTEIVDPLLQMPQIYHKEIRGISLYSETIKVSHGDTLLPMEEAKKKEWYSKLRESNLMYWAATTEGAKNITAYRKFYDSNEISAVLVMNLDFDSVVFPFTSLIKNNTGGMILDNNGCVVYSDYNMSKQYQPEQSDSIDYIKDHYTYSIREMKGTEWQYCIYRPSQIVLQSAMDILNRNIPIIFGCVILLGIIGYFASRHLVSRLELLTENMNQIHLGLRDVTVHSDSDDEIGVLIRSFQRMMDEMNRLISEVYESKIQLQNSEMKALVAQINPHFLYNSLSIINWKALEVGEDDISKITLALSTYYRTSLNRGETMTIIENEIQNIRAYLRIQEIMHDGNFKVYEDFDPTLYDEPVPKLILQPLVENAIDHGLDVSDKEKHILWISGKVEQDSEEVSKIVFEVRDNGVGMTESKKKELLEYTSKGYGVRNVRERIEVLYGSLGDVQVESEIGLGTMVRIIIPKK